MCRSRTAPAPSQHNLEHDFPREDSIGIEIVTASPLYGSPLNGESANTSSREQSQRERAGQSADVDIESTVSYACTVLLKNRTATKVIIAALKNKLYILAAKLTQLGVKFNCKPHLKDIPKGEKIELEFMKYLVDPKHITDVAAHDKMTWNDFTTAVFKANHFSLWFQLLQIEDDAATGIGGCTCE